MCGIAGMVGANTDPSTVGRMTAAQRHRGPDGQGLWSSPGVVLGHRRLKILDLSDDGRQPMSTADGRYTIVYNGEVYNYQELQRELSDVSFRSRTDTEVVLYAFAKWGLRCVERFVGMFSFAVWDRVDRALFCARDRMGIKPFYYARHEGQFVFASEIRPLLAAGCARAINEHTLYDFLARDFYEHTEDTFFAGISKLPPASWMIVTEDKVGTPQKYWHLHSEVEHCRVPTNSLEREDMFLQLCTDAVRSHLRSDVPIGVALSGGVDSATLLGLLDRTHHDPSLIQSFTFKFADATYSEQPYVEALAKQMGHKAHFVEVSPHDMVRTAETFTRAQEEPFAGAPITAYALCFERARELGFIVMMDGSGFDEGLAGYDRFRPALWADLFSKADWPALDYELRESGVVTAAQRKVVMEQIHAAIKPSADVGRGQDLTSSVRPDCLSEDFSRRARRPIQHFERCFPDTLRNLMYRELCYTKLPRALRFRDRLSMAVGTELRPPFLDHRLLAFEFALPHEDHISGGVSKAILRRATRRFLPETVRLASKRSVQTPQREWFRKDLKTWVRDHIDHDSFWNRGWIDKQRGKRAMEAFFKGDGNNSFFLWQWVNLQLWAEHVLEGGKAE